MCGIVGIIRNDEEKVDFNDILQKQGIEVAAQRAYLSTGPIK